MSTVICLDPYRFLPANTGGQKNIAFFYKYLGRHVDLIAITVADNQNELKENYEATKVFSNSKLRYINPFNYFRIKKIIKETEASHILVEHPYLGWLAVLLAKNTSAKLIVRSHNIEGLRFKSLGKWWWKLLLRYEGLIHRQADYNLFIQEEDMNYAVANFRLDRRRCTVLTYGIEQETPPAKQEKEQAKAYLCSKYGIDAATTIILFVGVFNYKPNIDAYRVIADKINPQLQEQLSNYKIFICGPHLDTIVNNNNIIVTGFVEDISTYFKAADVFINPVLGGGGIKTKLVEALGYNANAVSTSEGAIGVNPALTNNKLFIVENRNWQAFTKSVMEALLIQSNTPPGYYDYFYWGRSTKKIAEFIEGDNAL